jgi:hypothetical protein
VLVPGLLGRSVQISVEEQHLSALVSCRRVLDRLVDATAGRHSYPPRARPKALPARPRETNDRAKSWHIDRRDPLRSE